MRVAFEIKIDNLTRQVWEFWPIIEHTNECVLYLDKYEFQARKTTRHGWQSETRYNRIDSRGSIPLSDVPITDEIKGMARNIFEKTIVVKVWEKR